MKTIYLIRHGMTEANEKHLYCGSTDLPLSEAGREAVKALSYHVPEDAEFICSGMKRTVETLKLLFGDVPYRVEPDLREVDFGAFEMHSYEELKDRADYQAWLTGDNDANVTPGGESGQQMRERVLKAFDRLAGENRNLVIVSHGGVIASLMESLFPEEGKNRYQWQPKPGHGYELKDGSYRAIP